MKTAMGWVVAAWLLGAAGRAGASVPPRDPRASEGQLRVQADGEAACVPLKHTDVRVAVTGFLAQVDVEQTFQNPYARKIEATYLFPLPERAAVNGLDIVTGGRTIHGEIARKQEAKRIYEAAAAAGHVAALLEGERPNLFSQSVANIEPGAEIVVRIHYLEALRWRDGGYELVFPMVAGPRHVPRGSDVRPESVAPAVLPPGLRPAHEISLAVAFDAGTAARNLASPSHRIVVEGRRVGLARGDTLPNRDFILRWDVAGIDPSLGVAAGSGAFFLMIVPPRDVAAAPVAPREVVLVLDTSSSMAGAPLAKAKEAVRRVLGGLRAGDTFQLIRFGDSASALGAGPLPAEPEQLARALAWLGATRPGGGTDMRAGIRAALDMPHDPARLREVVFLTDGWVGNEDEVLALVRARIGTARLFSFGVGSAVNRWLLEEMAALGRGEAQLVRPDEDTAAAVERLQARIARPLLTDLGIDWNGLAVEDVTPAALPDLFDGQPLVVAGRYHAEGTATITVTGRRAGRPVSFATRAVLSGADRPEVATVWARARIAELERAQLRGARPEAAAEIARLALAHKLVTRATSFVAVDPASKTEGGPAEKVAVPVHVVEGMTAGAAYAMDGLAGTSTTGEVLVLKESSPMIDTGSTKLGSIVQQDYLKHIPLRGRTYDAVLDAAPGGPSGGPTSMRDYSYSAPPPPRPIAPPPGTPLPPEPVDGRAVDLGADRPPLQLVLPEPPRGGAATFTSADGRRGWVTRIPERNQLPTAAYGDGRVYVSAGFESRSVYALDAADGRIVWAAHDLRDNGPTAPIYSGDGKERRLIFNTESCTLFVLDATTGKEVWSKTLGDPTLAQPALEAGLVYASHPGDGGMKLSALRLADGGVEWSAATDGELLAAPVVVADAVYAATVTGRLYRFDPRRGTERWSRPLGATSAPFVAGGELFLGRAAGGRELQVVVSAGTGAVLREHESRRGDHLGDVPAGLSDWKKVWAFEGSRPVVAGGVRYAAMGGVIQASSAATGEPLWIRRYAGGQPGRALGAVAVAGPQVVIATRAGDLYGLDVDTGYTVWAYRTGKSIVAQPIVALGWVVATTTDGEVIALEVGDRTLDGWHMWGGDPRHNGARTVVK